MLIRLKTALIALLLNVRNRLPESLPVTDEAVKSLIKRVVEGCGLDPANTTLQNAIASTLLSLPQGRTSITVAELIAMVNQARLKQASYNIIEAIRTADKAAREAAIEETK